MFVNDWGVITFGLQRRTQRKPLVPSGFADRGLKSSKYLSSKSRHQNMTPTVYIILDIVSKFTLITGIQYVFPSEVGTCDNTWTRTNINESNLLSDFLCVVYHSVKQMSDTLFNKLMFVIGCSTIHSYIFDCLTELTYSLSLQR